MKISNATIARIRSSGSMENGVKSKAVLIVIFWCRERDSNPRRRMPADLQSALVGRLSIPAN
jgi:hypothetical protein